MSSDSYSLKELQQEFKDELLQHIAEIILLYQSLKLPTWDSEQVSQLHDLLVSLAGSAASFGVLSVSDLARQLEKQLKSILDAAEIPRGETWRFIGKELSRLESLIYSYRITSSNHLMPKRAAEEFRQSPLIFLIQDDLTQAQRIADSLRESRFLVEIFSNRADFDAAWEAHGKPAALVLDIDLPEGNSAGFELLNDLKAKHQSLPPVIFTSVNDDLDARLQAYRAGAQRYLCKPIDAEKFTLILNELTGRMPAEPYRIMLVDDDPLLLQAFSVLLEDAGMQVLALSEPRETLKFLNSFKPDVLVLDLYMPDIQGAELAAIVREQQDNLELPILFLSAETDISEKLLALSSGGDDFLVKPIKPKHLVSAVTIRARRKRQTSSLNGRLRLALYEREREHLALNKHALVSITDRKGNIVYFNNKFCQVSGYNEAELLGQNHRIVKSDVHPAEYYREIWRTISAGKVWQGEICNRRKNGQYYWVESTIMPFVGDDGKPYQYVSIRTDITEQKNIELQQRRRSAIQTMLTSAAERLLMAKHAIIDEVIEDVLGMAGGCLAASRAYLLQFNRENTHLSCTHQWCAPGIERQKNELQEIPIENLPWWSGKIKSGSPFIFSDIHSLPDLANAEKDGNESQALSALCIIPFTWSETIKGFIGFEKMDHSHDWKLTPLHLMNFLADLIGGALIRAATETKLREQQLFTRSVLDSSSANIAVLNQDGDIIAVNDPWQQFADQNNMSDTCRGFLGRNYLSVCRKDKDAREIVAGIESVITNKTARYRSEYPCHSPTRKQWFEMTVTPLKGGSQGVVISHADITDRKLEQLEAETARERLRYGQLFANIGTWEWVIDSGELFWSERIAPLLGYPDANLKASYDDFLKAIHPDDRSTVIDAANACIYKDKPYEIEHRVIWPDGTVRWLLERGAVLRDHNGKATRMIGVVQDIDDRKRTELALAERQQQLIEAQQLAKLGNWRANLVTGELFWADEIYRIFGYQPGAIVPTLEFFYRSVHPDDLALVQHSEQLAQQTGHNDMIHRIITPQGQVRYVHGLANVYMEKAGKPKAMVGTLQDVTERIEAEQKLHEIQQQYAFAVEGAGDGVWSWELATGSIVFSGNYEAMFGYQPGELETDNDAWMRSIHPGHLSDVEQQLASCLEGCAEKFQFEARIRCKSSHYKWVLCRGTVAQRDASGNPTQLIAILSDIDERKKAEQALQLFKYVVNSAVDGVVVIDSIGIIQLVNPQISAIFGHASEAMVGKNVSMLMPASVGAELEAYLHRYITTGEGRIINNQVEVTGVRADGSEFPLEAAISEINLGDNIQFVGLLRDITLRKEAESEIVKARQEAERANRAKSEFLSSMSHELRTPMNAILGFGQLMEYDQSLSEDHQDNVREIIKAGQHLLELINEVLDLAKVESGHISLSLESMALYPVIKECVALVTAMAVKKNIRISYRCANGLVVKTDRTRFKQVLLNLLSNAIKYNQINGSVSIEVGVEKENYVSLKVSDTGLGIENERLGELFQPFQRLHVETNEQGTGIGLTITRRIIELMGGTISVVSELGHGTTFEVKLPLESKGDQSVDSVDADAPLVQQKSQSTSELNETLSHTVIYIEDNPANLKLVKQSLRHLWHIRLLTAPTPSLGIELAIAYLPDLILLDINMPGMDGYQVMEVFKKSETLANIPVIAITANAMPDEIRKGKLAGFAEYLTKPLNIKEFISVVNRYLSGVHNEH